MRNKLTKYIPWKTEGLSMYETSGPPSSTDVEIEGIDFRVEPSGEGVHSLRTAYKVNCLTCGKEIHPRTTGPDFHITGHLMDKHRDVYDGIPEENTREAK